jgi:hypothetical protein
MKAMIGFSRCVGVGAALGLLLGCGSSDPKSAGAGGAMNAGGATGVSGSTGSAGEPAFSAAGASSSGGAPVVQGTTAADLAGLLGRPKNFLIGMGNDLANDHSQDGAYTLGTTLDLHYAYLVGLGGEFGWPDWNAGGTFVNVLTDTADAKGVTPMFTMYGMAAHGEGNAAALTDDKYMKAYWDGIKLLYQRIAAFGKPAVVHFEPDFWGFVEQQSKEDPSSLHVNLKNNAPDCADLTDDIAGMGNCLVKLARMYAPKALVGFHASTWAAGDPNVIASFLKKIGADKADLVFSDFLDRDAGCFEAHTDPNCQRDSSGVYWDETNATSPNFHDYLAWSKAISSGVGRPMMWWQTPFGVPSATPGGTAGHYRDNRVHYIFSHIQEFVDAGGLGVTFGCGAGNQTFIDTDGGQFKNAVADYYKHPVPLP